MIKTHSRYSGDVFNCCFSVFSYSGAVAIIIGTMESTLTIRGERFDPEHPIDISIPLNFNGPQPNAYGVDEAASRPCVAGDLIGDTRKGGSCNFEQYTFIPHCNGTHTECVGHITHARISVQDCLKDAFIDALVVTVDPEPASATRDTYSMDLADNDRVISRRIIETVVPVHAELGALVIRTMPNSDAKLTAKYIDVVPSYFTTEAMRSIVDMGFRHLIVDLPSIDRLYDEGRLSNHRIFWNIEPESCETNADTRLDATITELVYVPEQVEDGVYGLNLQIAPFVSDASPSRPLLFRKVEK